MKTRIKQIEMMTSLFPPKAGVIEWVGEIEVDGEWHQVVSAPTKEDAGNRLHAWLQADRKGRENAKYCGL